MKVLGIIMAVVIIIGQVIGVVAMIASQYIIKDPGIRLFVFGVNMVYVFPKVIEILIDGFPEKEVV